MDLNLTCFIQKGIRTGSQLLPRPTLWVHFIPVPCDPLVTRRPQLFGDFSTSPGLYLLGSFYLTRPLLLGEAPPLPRLPLLRRGLQPVNRLFCTRKQALAHKGLLVVIDAIELRLFVRRGRGAHRGGAHREGRDWVLVTGE